MIHIRKAPLSDVVKANSSLEWTGEIYLEQEGVIAHDIEFFSSRIKDARNLCVVAYEDQAPVGYVVCYDRFSDGSLYVWMAGVNPAHRRKGILSELMEFVENWAVENGFGSLKVKTRNRRRGMRAYLVKHNWNVFKVEIFDDSEDNRIWLEKKIGEKQ